MLSLLLQLSLFISEPCVSETVKNCVVQRYQNYEVKSIISPFADTSEAVYKAFIPEALKPVDSDYKSKSYTSGFV